jgi:hypothetical protein
MPTRLALIFLLILPSSLFGWSKESQVQIAWEAARLAPPDLYRQIVRHKLKYRDGLIEPFSTTTADHHEKNADGSGRLDEVIALETERAVHYIRAHYPFPDIVKQLGVLLHYVADANNPLYTSATDTGEARYAADFLRYMRSAEPRFAPAFYGVDRELDSLDAVPAFVERSLGRSRSLYPFIAKEYQRVDGRSGVEAFDDRSTAFGVAAVSYSRALTDAVAILRFVWLQAGGADPMPRSPLEAENIVRVPRAR